MRSSKTSEGNFLIGSNAWHPKVTIVNRDTAKYFVEELEAKLPRIDNDPWMIIEKCVEE
jgi:hypothetical protein